MTTKVYELYPCWGSFSVQTVDYHGTAYLVAATSVRQAYAVAHKDIWIDPNDDHPVGIVACGHRVTQRSLPAPPVAPGRPSTPPCRTGQAAGDHRMMFHPSRSRPHLERTMAEINAMSDDFPGLKQALLRAALERENAAR
jgi:hypothetical protein